MEDEVVIKVDGVYKDFILPHERTGSVKGAFTSMFSKATKKNEIQHALRDINLEVKKGEFFGIVGRNGSGKSTLLKILAGIYQPTKGEISTHGKLVPFIELGVGFNPELSGRDNVYLNGAVLGFSTKEVDAIYDEIVDFAELRRFMDQKLKNYSSGMQVRLAFSLAIRAQADILLFDEVLAVGDADFQRKCFKHFRELKKQKKTVVFVSHDMASVREYCDRVIMIEKSRVVAAGDPEKVAVKYSRMFMEKTNDNQKKGDDDNRWGNGEVTYKEVKVIPTEVKENAPVTIVAVAKANIDIQAPVYGFSIKNEAGQNLLGTNSRIKKQRTKDLKKGEEYTVKWEVPDVLGDGSYYVNVAIAKSDGSTECDWWEEATNFTVYKEEKTPYIITPDVGLVLDSEKQ